MDEGALVVPDNLNPWSEGIGGSGCRFNTPALVFIRENGGGGGGCRLLYLLAAPPLRGQSPMGDGSWPSSCID